MKRLQPLIACGDPSPAFDGSMSCEVWLVQFANGRIGHIGQHRVTDSDDVEISWFGPGHPLSWKSGHRRR